MPDHVHLLIEGCTDDADCRAFIARAKQYSGFHYSKQYRTALWQRYGFERILRDHEPPSVAARYILANPVRAGLVQRIEDYPFVGSFIYTTEQLIEWAFGEVQSD